MLQVDLRDLARGPVDTSGELAAAEPVLEGLDFVLAAPVTVTGRLQSTGEGRCYWQGVLRTVVAGECRRCLTPVTLPIEAQVGVLFSQATETFDDSEDAET